jgi:hypothetical protein
MTAILFDRLSYIDRLRRAGVIDDLARSKAYCKTAWPRHCQCVDDESFSE